MKTSTPNPTGGTNLTSMLRSTVRAIEPYVPILRFEVLADRLERPIDEIIKLEEFADRILSFKRNTLYIINVSDEEEYLENVYHGYGIEEPHQAVKTQHGVVFVNSSGLYFVTISNNNSTI